MRTTASVRRNMIKPLSYNTMLSKDYLKHGFKSTRNFDNMIDELTKASLESQTKFTYLRRKKRGF